MAELVLIGPGTVGAFGEVPIMPVPGGLPMIAPGAEGLTLVVPLPAPEDIPEGVDTAPPTAAGAVGAAFGPVLPYPTPTTVFVFQSRVEGAFVGGTLERYVCARVGS
jgi:hypothetical protein